MSTSTATGLALAAVLLVCGCDRKPPAKPAAPVTPAVEEAADPAPTFDCRSLFRYEPDGEVPTTELVYTGATSLRTKGGDMLLYNETDYEDVAYRSDGWELFGIVIATRSDDRSIAEGGLVWIKGEAGRFPEGAHMAMNGDDIELRQRAEGFGDERCSGDYVIRLTGTGELVVDGVRVASLPKRDLPPGLRRPSAAELSTAKVKPGGRGEDEADETAPVLSVRADFDGDGRKDEAAFLMDEDAGKEFPYVLWGDGRPPTRLGEGAWQGTLWGLRLDVAAADAGGRPELTVVTYPHHKPIRYRWNGRGFDARTVAE